jgi:hypothetical protein
VETGTTGAGPVAISGRARNALFEEIVARLHSISDLEMALERHNHEVLEKLGRNFADDLTLISEDLGWEPVDPEATIVLRSSPDVLRRAFARWRDVVLGLDSVEASERAALRERGETTQVVVSACDDVLKRVGGRSVEGR